MIYTQAFSIHSLCHFCMAGNCKSFYKKSFLVKLSFSQFFYKQHQNIKKALKKSIHFRTLRKTLLVGKFFYTQAATFVLCFLKGTAIGTVIQIFGVAFSTKQIRFLFQYCKKHVMCEFKISNPRVCAICFSDLGQDKLCLTAIE